jgi:coiled-coil domain-containing protein 63/114
MFLEAEDKNFSLFNYVNELNSDIEKLEMQISDTKIEIEKYKGQGVSTDTQRKQILRNLEDKLERTELKTKEYNKSYEDAMGTINHLKTGIHSIFSRIGCGTGSTEEMLGNQGVTESNMMQYLGLIEQRTSEILQLYAQSQQALDNPEVHAVVTSDKSASKKPYGGVQTERMGIMQPAHKRLTVNPPAFEDFSDDDESDREDDERPLTRDELKRKWERGNGRNNRGSAGKVGTRGSGKKK